MKNKSFKEIRSFSRNPIAAAALILLTGHAQAGTDLPDLGNHHLPNGITLDNSTAGTLHITQQAAGQSGKPTNSQIDWDSFSVGENMHVYFDQPNASSVILNRVVGADASSILGNIQANGRIFLINPNGITFGVNSQVNVGSLVASTLKLDEGETSKNLSTIVLNGQSKGSTGLVQQGAINANQIALIGATVTNTGSLNASAGVEGQQPKVYLIAAQKVTADTTGDYIVLTPEAGAEQALLQSLGSIDAGNGTITLIAKSDGTGDASVLNLQGVMKAGSLHTSDSGITLQADQIQQTVVDGQTVNPLQTTGSLDIQAKQVDLSRSDNQISGAVSVVSGGDAKLSSSSGLTVDQVQATGAADLQSGVDIHVNGELSAGSDLSLSAKNDVAEQGDSSITVGGETQVSGASIDLSASGNDFKGALALTSGSGKANIHGQHDLVLGNVTSQGDLTLTAGTKLSQAADTAVSVKGAGNVTAQSVDLTQANNDFGAVLSATATDGSVSVVAKNNVVLGKTDSTKDLTVTAGGQLSQVEGTSATVGGATTVQAQSVALDQAGNDFTGAVTAISDTGKLSIADKSDLVLGNVSSKGDLTLNAEGGLSQVAGTAVTAHEASNVTAKSVDLTQVNNNFAGVLSAQTTDGNVSIVDKDDLVLGNTDSTKDLTVTAVGQLSQVKGTAATVEGATTVHAQSVALDQAGNDFTGAVTATSEAGKLNIADKSDLILGNTVSTKDLTVTAGGQLGQGEGTAATVGGATTVKAQSVVLDQTGNDFKSELAVASSVGAARIHDQNNLVLGDVTSKGDLNLSAEGDLTQVAGTALSAQGAGNVTAKSVDLSQTNNDFGGVLSVTSTAGNIAITDKDDLALGNTNSVGDLAVTAGAQLTEAQGAAVTVNGTSTVQAKSVVLNQAGNYFIGAISATSKEGMLSIADKSDLVLGNVSSKGDLTLSAAGGLSQVAGTAVAAQAASNVTAKSVNLTQTNNDFSGVLSTTSTAGNIGIADKNALALGKTDSTGGLTLTAGTQLTQAQGSAVTVVGATTVQAQSIALDQAGNDFKGLVSTTAGNTSVVDKNDLVLGAVNSDGDLSITVGGQLSQAQNTAMAVAATTTAQAQSVVLDQASNDFKGALTATSSNGVTQIQDQNDLLLGNITSNGDLMLSAKGELTQVEGTAVYAQAASDVTAQSVNLTQGNNDFMGAVAVKSTKGNIGVVDKNDLVLGNVNGANDLNLNAKGELSQVADTAVSAHGASNVTDQSVNLTQNNNDFVGTVIVKSTNGGISVVDKNDLTLGDTDSAQDLNVTAEGQLTQAQGTAVTVDGPASVQAQSVVLDQNGNDFNGALAVTSRDGVARIHDQNDLLLGAITSKGDLTLSAEGDLTQVAGTAVSAQGVSNVTAKSVDLSQTNNDFGGALSAKSTNGNVSLVDKDDLVLGNTDSKKDLTVTAGGQLTQAQGTAATVSGATTVQAQSVALDQTGNDFKGALAITSSNGLTNVHDQNDLVLGNIDSAGDLTVTAEGQLTESKNAAINVVGASAVHAQSVALDQAGNDFKGALAATSTAGNTNIADKTDLVLGNVSSTGDVNLNAQGALSQLAGTAVSAQGSSNVTAQSIDLTQTNNDFGGALSTKSTNGSVSIVDKNDLVLGNTESAKDLTVTAGGQLTQLQGAAATVVGATTVRAQTVALDQASNDFKGALAATSTAGNTNVADKSDLALGNVSSAGDLNLNVDGQLLQQNGASAAVAGTTHLQAAAVSLTQADNQWSGAVYSSTHGGGTDLASKGNLALGNVNTSGALNLSATGNLTQLNNTAVNVAQGGVINAKSVDLRQAGNDFQGAVSLNSNGGYVAVFDKNDFTFDSGQTKGNLSVQALGQLTQVSGSSVKVSGNSSLNGRGVALGESGNDFGDAVSASAGSGDVALGDSNDLVIGSGYVAGNLQVHAAGRVTQANGAAMSVNGITDLTGKSVSLDQADNHFSGRVSATSGEGQISLADNGNLNVGDVHSAGSLLLHAKGDLTQVDQTSLVASGSTDLQAKSMDLQQLGNEFSGAVSVSTTDGNATLFDKSDLQLDSGSVQGVLNVRAEDAISQKSGGAIAVAGQTALQAKSVSVDQLGNDFKGVVSVVGTPNAVALGDKNDLSLGAVNTSGDLTLKALGQVSQAASTALSVQGETTVSGGSVTLNQADNKLVGAVSASSTEGAIVINNSDSLKLGAVSSAGDLNISAQGELSQVAGTAVTVQGASHVAAQSINLTEASNDLGGALSATTSAGSVSVVDQNDLALDNTSSAGDLNIVAGGKLTQAQGTTATVNGATVVQAQSVQLDQAGNDFKGVLTSTSTVGNTSIKDKNDLALGNTGSTGDLTVVAGGQLTETQGAVVTVKGSSAMQAQSIALDQAGNDFTGALVSTSNAGGTHVVDKNDLTLANTNSAGELIVASGGQLSEAQNAAIVVNGASTLQAQSVTLNQAGNDFKRAVTAASTTGNARVDDQNDLLLGNISSAGGLTLHAQGSLSQVEGTAVSAQGASNLVGKSIDLTQTSNDFGGALSANSTAGNTHVFDKNDLVLGNVNSAADLTATAGGQLSEDQGAALNVAGTTQLQAQSIAVDQSGNDFKGALTATSTAGSTHLVDKNDLILGDVSSKGDLNVNAKGGLGQVTGTAVSAERASNLAAQSIDLTQVNNDFGGALSIAATAGNTNIVDKNDLVLGSVNSAGDLHVDANGALGQIADTAISAAGLTTVQAQSITLDRSGNDFKGPLTTNSREGSTKLIDKNALVLGNVNSAGDLNVKAEGGLSQVADTAITAAGMATVQAQSIALNQSGNNFKGELTSNSTAGDTSITDKSDLALGNISSAGDLNVVAGGQLAETEGAVVAVNGASNLQAQSIALNQSGNDFKGVLTSNSTAGNTSISDKNDLIVANTNSAGDLALQAQGNITQADGATVTVQGLASVTGQNVDLGHTNNDFSNGLSLNATADATVRDRNDLLVRGATVGKNLSVQAEGLSQTDAIAVGQATHVQAQSVDLSNLNNQWGVFENLNVGGDVRLAGQHVNFGNTQVGGNLLVSADQVAQTHAISVHGATQIQASAGNVDLQRANQLQSALTLSGDQVLVRNTLPTHLASLNSKGGKLESDGILYLEGNVFQGGGDFTFLTHATPAALSQSQIKGIQISELDAYSDKSAVDPFSGVSDLSISSPGIEQTGGVIQTNQGAKTHFESAGNASIILNRDNQMNGLFSALSGAQYGSKYVYSYVKGASLVSVNNLVPLSTADQGVEADMVAIRADGLTTPDDSVLRARLPYNDLLVGASQSYPGLVLSIPVDSANRVNNNGVYEFGAQQTGGNLGGAIHVEVGNPDLPGFGGYSTVLPYQGAVVAPNQLVFLRGPKVSRLYSFYYDGAGNVTRIPVSYNGYIVLSPQESAALTSSQGSVNLARQEQQQSVIRTENVSGQVINGVIVEVGTGRPATEGTGGIAKPATCGSTNADQGC